MSNSTEVADPIATITAAESHALAEHDAGRCHLSEFSCSACER